MKALASSLLLVAAVVYGLTSLAHDGDHGWVGFIRTGSEAAMVGGLADWFAVTDLFRRPLGLPIPHTALIPTRKDSIGESLAEFVQQYFLSPEVVSERLADAGVVPRVGRYLVAPGRAERVVGQVTRTLHLALEEVRKDGVHSDELSTTVARLAMTQLSQQSFAPLAGRLLRELVADGRQKPVVDLLISSTHRWLRNNRGVVVRSLGRPVPGFVPRFLKDTAVEHVWEKALELAEEVLLDPHHELRESLDRLLLETADELVAGGPAAVRFEGMVRGALTHPQSEKTVADLLQRGLALLTDLAETEGGPLQELAVARLVELGARLASDTGLVERIDEVLQRVVVQATRQWAGEFTTLITTTVAKWDGVETSARIENQVGRDLQFIRINGTVVGALAGVAIHTVTVVLGG